MRRSSTKPWVVSAKLDRVCGLRVAAWSAALLAGLLQGGTAMAEGWTDPSGKTWTLVSAPGEWIVEFPPTLPAGEARDLLARSGLGIRREYGPRTRSALVQSHPEEPLAVSAERLAALRPGVATPVLLDDEGFRKYLRPDRLTVQFHPGVDEVEAEAAIAAIGSRVLRSFRTSGYYEVEVPAGPGDRDPSRHSAEASDSDLGPLFAALRAFSALPGVRFAEPTYLGFDDALLETPDDPFFGSQWALRNPGNGAWEETADVWADGAWWITKGAADVVLAIVDTGMDLAHEDLAANLLPQGGEDWDFLDPDLLPQDLDNHGTFVSGIASAVQGNARGVSGLAPGCRIMPLRVSLDEGEIAERVDAIQYCASRRPEFAGLVVNCSWGNSSGDFTSVRTAIQDAIAAGCVVVCAAGNSNGAVVYPARYPEPIAVGASSPCDERKSPSSCDGEPWGSCFGPELDVVAPGARIFTTDRTGNLGLSSGNYWPFFSGTSASTAFVSALAGLVQSLRPEFTPAEVRAVIEAGADDGVGDPAEDLPGRDDFMGWGRINSWKTLVLATHPEGFVDDLEIPDSYWRHGPVDEAGPDPWHLTTSHNHTEGGLQCWWGAEAGSGSYPADLDAALYLPDFCVPPGGALAFWHRLDAHEITSGVAGDGGFLEASADGGATWFLLQPQGGYTHLISGVGDDPYPPGQPVFSGSFSWREERVDLAEYAGAPLRIRFRFGARVDATPAERGAGWRIDDVAVTGLDPAGLPASEALPPAMLTLDSIGVVASPGGRLRFSLGRSATVDFDLYAVDGRRQAARSLGRFAAGAHEVALDPLLADAPSGVYWLRLAAVGGRVSTRVVIVE